MKELISHLLKQVAAILEYVIAFMLAIGIILLCLRMVCSLQYIPNLNTYPNYDDLLEVCFNLIIGVELIRMMYSHSPSTVFEVLLFAIARHIIMDHTSIYSSLIGVCSIAVLFATRKFLFSEFDIADETVFRASTKAKVVNKILSVNIPHEADDTLSNVLLRHLEEQNITPRVGACYYFHDCDKLPSFIIKRLPVRLTFDNNYFNALYQGIPVGGYTKMVENMLEGIDVKLGVDYFDNKSEYDAMASKVVYTGAIDAYFDYKLGTLEYRSVRFENEILDIPNFQGNAAVNYTDSETPWTRIIEHKWFEFGKDEEGNDLPKTVISREYSAEWKPGDEPYYPVNDEKNGALYEQYKELAQKEDNIIFGGRLGEYKYYDMDAVIASALEMSEKELV